MEGWNGGDLRDVLLSLLDRMLILTELLTEAHELGFGPGTIESLDNPDFHLVASSEYAAILSLRCRESIADCYQEAARDLRQRLSSSQSAAKSRVHAYITGVAESLAATATKTPRTLASSEGRLLPHLPYPRLASLVTRAAPLDLRRGVLDVLRELEGGSKGRYVALSDEDIQLVRAIADGTPMVEIAAVLGWSERSLYRRSKAVWKQLGATNRSDGILIASRLGLVSARVQPSSAN